MSEFWTITSEICQGCGTELLVDNETCVKVHRDITYKSLCNGADEAWGDGLIAIMGESEVADRAAAQAKPLRLVR